MTHTLRYPRIASSTGSSVRDRGGSIIEVAITLPFFMVLLVTAAMFAMLWHDSIEVCSAARAGVQYGMQNSSTATDLTGMQAVALQNMGNISGKTAVASNFCQCESALGTNVSCTSTCAYPQTVPIQFVQVQTSASVVPAMITNSPTGVLREFGLPVFPSSYALAGKAVMRVQE